jgi:hypothetical protein
MRCEKIVPCESAADAQRAIHANNVSAVYCPDGSRRYKKRSTLVSISTSTCRSFRRVLSWAVPCLCVYVCSQFCLHSPRHMYCINQFDAMITLDCRVMSHIRRHASGGASSGRTPGPSPGIWMMPCLVHRCLVQLGSGMMIALSVTHDCTHSLEHGF